MDTRRKSMMPTVMTLLVGIVVGLPIGVLVSDEIGRGAPVVHVSHGDGHATMPVSKSGAMASEAFQAANARMHSAMTYRLTGDVDLDFARGMIPHHQGAVDMALIEIEHGSDPTMRMLARRIVSTQKEEIETLKEWSSNR